MTDEEFLAAFENCTLAKTDFNHYGHLRMCWCYLNKYSYNEAQSEIITGIKRFASSFGKLEIYHETLTITWIKLVQLAMVAHPNHDSFGSFYEDSQSLLAKDKPFDYFTESRLMGIDAKEQWLEPDVQAF